MHDQSVGRFGFASGLSPWFVENPSSLCPHVAPACAPIHTYVSVCTAGVPSPSYTDTSSIGLGPTSWPHLTSVTSLKVLSPNVVTLGISASTWVWRHTIQYITGELPLFPRVTLVLPKKQTERLSTKAVLVNIKWRRGFLKTRPKKSTDSQEAR